MLITLEHIRSHLPKTISRQFFQPLDDTNFRIQVTSFNQQNWTHFYNPYFTMPFGRNDRCGKHLLWPNTQAAEKQDQLKYSGSKGDATTLPDWIYTLHAHVNSTKSKNRYFKSLDLQDKEGEHGEDWQRQPAFACIVQFSFAANKWNELTNVNCTILRFTSSSSSMLSVYSNKHPMGRPRVKRTKKLSLAHPNQNNANDAESEAKIKNMRAFQRQLECSRFCFLKRTSKVPKIATRE